MGQGHALLKSGCTGRMLDERQALGMILQVRQFLLFSQAPAVAGTKQPRFLAERYVAEHIVREFLVDDDGLGLEVCRDSSQSGAVLGGLNLEIGIGKKDRKSV